MPGSAGNSLGARSLNSIERKSAPHTPAIAEERKVTFVARLSFALATRLVFRKLATSPNRGYLSISFDDIPRSAWSEGGAILRRNGIRGTYYLSGDLCGKTFEGREQYRRSDVCEILSAGHELGSHLFHHRSALNLSSAEIRKEIDLNDTFLREVAGPDVHADSLAYPYGEVSVATKWLSSRRFISARGVQPGLNCKLADRDLLRVLPVDNLYAEKTDWSAILDSITREKAWGIVLAHGVDDSGHDYSCPPGRLETIIQSAQAAGVCILPVGDVMRRLRRASA